MHDQQGHLAKMLRDFQPTKQLGPLIRNEHGGLLYTRNGSCSVEWSGREDEDRKRKSDCGYALDSSNGYL